MQLYGFDLGLRHLSPARKSMRDQGYGELGRQPIPQPQSWIRAVRGDARGVVQGDARGADGERRASCDDSAATPATTARASGGRRARPLAAGRVRSGGRPKGAPARDSF